MNKIKFTELSPFADLPLKNTCFSSYFVDYFESQMILNRKLFYIELSKDKGIVCKWLYMIKLYLSIFKITFI